MLVTALDVAVCVGDARKGMDLTGDLPADAGAYEILEDVMSPSTLASTSGANPTASTVFKKS